MKSRKVPRQKPGNSKQDYRTPREFLDAVEERFGPLDFDLAATAENTVVPEAFFDERRDALSQSWHLIGGLLWLNCPFGRIKPWARKCAIEARRGARILFLTPASVGSDWFADHVHRHAYVLALRPRIVFVGEENGFPKDLQLAVYDRGMTGFDTWKWK